MPGVRNLADEGSYRRGNAPSPMLSRDRSMEEILIPLFAFSFIYLTIKMILDYKKSKLNQSSGEADRSLEMSELKALIREAVEEAQEPLFARLEALEGRRPELPPAERAPLLEIPEPGPEAEAAPPPAPVRPARRRRG
jgi:hypothetical protein